MSGPFAGARTANLLASRTVLVALRSFDHPSSVARLAPLSASVGALVSSHRNGYALPSERQPHACWCRAHIFQRTSSNGASVSKRTGITPNQLKMTYNPPICKIAILGLSYGGRVCRTLGPNDPIKGSGLRVRQWRCRYRLGKTRAGSAFNLGIFAVRRSSRSYDIDSASMRLTASASRQGAAVDLMPADRPLLRRPTPTSHFFNRLKRRTKTEANSNSFSTTSAICSISTIRSYVRVWTLDYWRGSARRLIGSATV
jgi:hypothetical protein